MRQRGRRENVERGRRRREIRESLWEREKRKTRDRGEEREEHNSTDCKCVKNKK